MTEYDYRPVEEDEIDLVELVQTFWDERILIVKIVGAFLVLGLLIALFSPVEYTTEAVLMPEAQSSRSVASGLLQQYGGLLGLSGSGSMGREGTIPPQLYPNIIESLPYQVELMNTPVEFTRYDTTVTPHIFFSEIYSPFSLIGFIKGYTIGLPGKIKSLFSSDEEHTGPLIKKVDRDLILSLSREQMATANKIKDRLTISIDQGGGIVSVSSEFPDPQASAEIAQAGIKLLKEYMREYRTQKATEDMKFMEEQVAEAKEDFEQAQQNLAKFKDSNLNLATARAQTRQQELQSQYDLTFDLYNSLNQRLQQARIQVQEQTPVFSVLQPVSVPLNKSAPNTLLILFVFGFTGGVLAIGWVVISSWWRGAKAGL